ncbi:hypothetical protein JTE90_004674 [Oedothorax gibbosus]|uniref:Uncharacterized protein n=1 Tax=Oedothorax gibbosus TaxID=931172 RepID=A0AAV6U9N3_9ARAC|nr:hypothetical protein JTE90_004674 [Oedothorax gibbosus]
MDSSNVYPEFAIHKQQKKIVRQHPPPKSLRRTALCTLEPNKCQWNQSDFCIRYPKYCIKDQDPLNAVPKHLYHQQHNISLEYLNAVGQRLKDLVRYCAIKTGPDSYLPCTNRVYVPFVNWKSYPNKCFILEMLWGQPDAQPKSIPVASSMIVGLQLHPEEYVDHNEAVQAHVLVHDPRALDNPIREGISLMLSKAYSIYVSQTVTERLPAPYRTNCTDYLKLWRENGGDGPLTRKVSMQPVFGVET